MPIHYARTLTGRTRTPQGNRRLGYTLAFTAGAVNAGGFLAVRQYTSHMTGIVSTMANNLALGDFSVVSSAATAAFAFLFGAVTCSVLVHTARQRHMHSEFALPLLLEAGILLCFGLTGRHPSQTLHLLVPIDVLLLCFAMGLQNAVITKVSRAEIRTTHVTGIVTDLGIELGKLIYLNAACVPPPLVARADRVRLCMLGILLASFIAGGVAGAFGFQRFGCLASVPLAALLIALAIVPTIDDLVAVVRHRMSGSNGS